jgi:hypothetical protein
VRANDDWGASGVAFNSRISDDEDTARVSRAELPNQVADAHEKSVGILLE